MLSPSPPPSPPLLTLEPLLESVREGLERAGWELSGLQKTTSYEFEGRWAGDSSRSAYLFFHREGLGDGASIDVFLDETSQGLKGNLALVLDGPCLGESGGPQEVLASLAGLARTVLPAGHRTPITLRFRLAELSEDPAASETEYRIKIHIPGAALRGGHTAVSALATAVAQAFEALLGLPGIRPLLSQDS